MARVVCSVTDCSKPSRARTLCGAHYQRFAKYGDPLFVPQRPAELDRYLRQVDTSGGEYACWLWTGLTNKLGYGRIYADGRHWLAHRLGYLLQVGPIPDGAILLHSCDNPPCQNPRHLSTGDIEDNVRDMIAKGRNKLPPPPPPGNQRWRGRLRVSA